MGTGRRHKTPGLELKDSLLLTPMAITTVSVFFLLVLQPPVSTEQCKEGHRIAVQEVGWL